ncbi:MAG: hypothetical protein H0V24_06725 [Chloroflexia bacterium]|nr:hypothetical protein [Chloroflexia bacterium]MDQ3413302.1 hypothetical protein [Chloroflexota bacterium]
MSKQRPTRSEEPVAVRSSRASERAAWSVVPPAPLAPLAEPAPAEGQAASDWLLDPAVFALESQRASIETLEAQLERAVDALIAHRLDDPTDLGGHRQVLFDLYEADIISKPEVRRRGDLAPAEFYDEIRKYRVRKRQP